MDNIPVVVFDCSSCPFMIDGFDRYYCHLDVNKTFPDLGDFITHKMMPSECPLIHQNVTVKLSEPVRRSLLQEG